MPKYNAKVKKPGSALSSIWPKMAINLVNEDLHYLLASASSTLPTTDDFVIVEPLFEGWGELGKENLYAPGFFVQRSGTLPSEPITVELDLSRWNTSMGATSLSQYNIEAPNIGGNLKWEETSVTYPSYITSDGGNYSPYGSSYNRLWSTACLQPGTVFHTMGGSITDLQTGVETPYLEDSNGVKQLWNNYDIYGEKSIRYPGVVVLDTKIIGIVQLYQSNDEMVTYELYQWDRNGKFIDSKPLGYIGNFFELIDVSEEDFWLANNVPDSATMGLLYKVHSTDTELTVTEITGSPTDVIRRAFYRNGMDNGTRKFSTRGEEGFAYCFNGGSVGSEFGNTTPTSPVSSGQGLFKLDADGVVWRTTIPDIISSATWESTEEAMCFTFVGRYNGKVYCGAYGSNPDDLRFFEIDDETGAILRVTDNCSIGSDSYLNNVLINDNGILCAASYTGFSFVNLNTMTHIVSRYCTDEGLNFYESFDFVSNDRSFWFMNDSGSVIMRLSPTGNHCDFIFTDVWWGANGASPDDFAGYFDFPYTYKYVFIDANHQMYPDYFDMGWNSPFVDGDAVYVLARVQNADLSPHYFRYFKISDMGVINV